MKRSLAVGAASAALLLALTACGDSDTEKSAEATTSASATAAATAAAESGEHNEADVTFAQMMIPHHTQAIGMSDVLLAKAGIDPRVIALAEQVKAAQAPEVLQLNGWLDAWGQPAAAPMPTSPMEMPGHEAPTDDSGMGMPGMSGMMSAEDMQALDDAQGTEAAKLFLTQMIEHHRGAITMAQTEIDSGTYPPAVEMAKTIAETQQQEIATMEQLLSSL